MGLSSCAGNGFEEDAIEALMHKAHVEFCESPTLEDFQNDNDGTYLNKLREAIKALRVANVNWFADFVEGLMDEFETAGDVRDTWYMTKDFISDYNNFQICQRESDVAHAMMEIFSPTNVGLILSYADFSAGPLRPGRHMSNNFRPKFVRGAAVSIAAKILSKIDEGFSTFTAFKRAHGNAQSGKAWHHIVEQNQITKSGFDPRMVHHPDNLIQIEHGAGSWHSRIGSAYQRHGEFPEIPANMSLRDWLTGKPYDVHYEWGIKVMNHTK